MKHQPDLTTSNFLNLGSEARIAGRDYYEKKIPDSIKMYLATTASAQLDEEAIDNERLFGYRFGLDVPRPVREQIIAIKNTLGVTDAECRWLRRSGQIRVTRSGAKLVPDRLIPAVGGFYAFSLLIVFASACVGIAISTAPAWKLTLISLALAGLATSAFWFVHRLFIAPWYWLRSARKSS